MSGHRASPMGRTDHATSPGNGSSHAALPSEPKHRRFNAVIESPKGSRNKFTFVPERGVFELGKQLPSGAVFPFDFGFVSYNSAVGKRFRPTARGNGKRARRLVRRMARRPVDHAIGGEATR